MPKRRAGSSPVPGTNKIAPEPEATIGTTEVLAVPQSRPTTVVPKGARTRHNRALPKVVPFESDASRPLGLDRVQSQVHSPTGDDQDHRPRSSAQYLDQGSDLVYFSHEFGLFLGHRGGGFIEEKLIVLLHG
jgi:hypothetical protein